MSSEKPFLCSVRTDENKCTGCINCVKRCPTSAIRVRDGKAHIIKEFCIDCGECVKACPHHAQLPVYDSLAMLDTYQYKVALPSPALYAQFNNLEDTGLILGALTAIGFDEVFETAAASDAVSEMSRKYIKENPKKKPLISTACPSVIRLIHIKFPNLLSHLSPFNSPMDVTAGLARKSTIEKTGLSSEKIGIFFISPCSANYIAAREPLGITKSEIDGVLAIKEIYPLLLSHMKRIKSENLEIINKPTAGRIGVGWASSGGESEGILTDSYLAADGIDNVIRVLEALEDKKYRDLEFIELRACSGGCVGGVLTVENPYIAQSKLRKICKNISDNSCIEDFSDYAFVEKKIEFKPVFTLGNSFLESLHLVAQADEIVKKFPGKDCGVCGTPSCRALAEDIVRGKAKESDCAFLS